MQVKSIDHPLTAHDIHCKFELPWGFEIHAWEGRSPQGRMRVWATTDDYSLCVPAPKIIHSFRQSATLKAKTMHGRESTDLHEWKNPRTTRPLSSTLSLLIAGGDDPDPVSSSITYRDTQTHDSRLRHPRKHTNDSDTQENTQTRYCTRKRTHRMTERGGGEEKWVETVEDLTT